MFKKTIKYKDFNGQDREKDAYFHLSKTELREMELSESGGMTERINRIIQAQDVPEIYKVFKGIVLAAYGVKSADGERFEKSAELTQAFTQSNAYDVLMDEISTNADAAANFINQLIPSAT